MSGTIATARATVNFTGLRQISGMSFKLVRASGNNWSYKVGIPELADLAEQFPNSHVVIAFRADCSYQRERFIMPIRQAAALSGVLEGPLQKVDDPGDIRLEVSVADAGHKRLAFGEMHSPDGVEDLEEETGHGKGRGRKVSVTSRLVQTEAPRGALFHVEVNPRTGSMFDVVYRKGATWLDMPTITVHPSLGKSAVLTPSPLRTVIMVSSLRTMLLAVATRPECQEAGWYDAWVTFAGTLAPDGEGIAHFTGGEAVSNLESGELDLRINEAIARFVKSKGLIPANENGHSKEFQA